MFLFLVLFYKATIGGVMLGNNQFPNNNPFDDDYIIQPSYFSMQNNSYCTPYHFTKLTYKRNKHKTSILLYTLENIKS